VVEWNFGSDKEIGRAVAISRDSDHRVNFYVGDCRHGDVLQVFGCTTVLSLVIPILQSFQIDFVACFWTVPFYLNRETPSSTARHS
jgi:hypothetical protein